MKTFKTLTVALLITLSSSAFANDKTSNYKMQIEYTLNTYMNAIAHGQLKGLDEVMDKDVKYTFSRADKIYNYGKSDLLKFLKTTENVHQKCVTESSLIEQSGKQTIFRITMKYDGFTKINYLNIANTANGWKITNITNAFI